jgi:cystathionine beta-lyase/cystathionine gamma-synthase
MTDADAPPPFDLILTQDGLPSGGPVVPPIVQTSLFTFGSVAEMRDTFAGRIARPVYSRVTNPTVRAFEEKITALEGAADAVATASGMAAISAAVLAHVGPGDRIVAVRNVYPDAWRFFEIVLRRFGVATDYVDGRDHAAVAAAVRGARLLYLESPTSWLFEALDVPALAAIARDAGALSVIDNSWATPILQRPLAAGVDLVVHSASKYIGGHSDVVAGAIAGGADAIARIRTTIMPYIGAKLSPFEAWLLVRGLRTLSARVERQGRAAAEIARRLATLPDVAAVHCPGVTTPLAPGLTGNSGLFAFELRTDRVDVAAFCDGLRLFRLGVSWGGHESLVCPAIVTLDQATGPNHARFFGHRAGLVRLSIGLEPVEDLWSDLTQALAQARGTG